MAAGFEISTILSNAGRIEKVNQSPFLNGDAARHVLTENEAQQRLQRSQEVNEGKEGQEVTTRDRQERREQQAAAKRRRRADEESDQSTNSADDDVHLIDVVV